MNLDAERERLREEANQIGPICRNAGLTRSANLIDSMLALIDAQASALAEMQAETIERCAKVCDAAEEFARRPSPAGRTSYAEGRRDGADCLAQAIRALGKGT